MPPSERDQELAGHELSDLFVADEGLTKWEVDFIEDMGNWPLDKPFTVDQIKKIRQIWDRVYG